MSNDDIWDIKKGDDVWIYKDWELWKDPHRQFVVMDIAPSRLFVAINIVGLIEPHDFVMIECKNKQIEDLEKLAQTKIPGSWEWVMIKDQMRAIREEQQRTDTRDMTIGHVKEVDIQPNDYGGTFCVLTFSSRLNQDPRIGGRIWRIKGRNRTYINEKTTEKFHKELKDKYGGLWHDYAPIEQYTG